MRYPQFAKVLRQYGTPSDIIQHFGFSRRQTFEYLAGRSLPRTEKILQYPDLVAAAQEDIAAGFNVSAEPLAA